ncbi:MAG: HXXEE domain-containing protein [Micrococcales bacterium]|nr:MAG: HXXEE domain-containing protein [Micrococcales bacterium]PIE26846.1 MAG: HXXEE domain-containing protein [Micrococcales bacterium]
MNDNDRAWALTALLLGVHQGEEVAVSMVEWLDRVGTTGIPQLDDYIRSHPLAGTDPRARAGVVAGQGAALWVVYRATRDSARATRVVTSALTLGWSAAFCLHICVSARTHSFMPGTATSLLPGLPGAVIVLRRIRKLTRCTECRASSRERARRSPICRAHAGAHLHV